MDQLRHVSTIYSYMLRLPLSPWKPCLRTYWYRRGYLPPDLEPGSYPFPKRQVPKIGQLSYVDRIAAFSADQVRLPPVDIGLPYRSPSELPNKTRVKNTSLEAVARKRQLIVPVESLHSPTSADDSHAPLRRLSLGRHYGVFNDTFGSPHFFVPSVDLNLYYLPTDVQPDRMEHDGKVDVQPVYFGNLLTPACALLPPSIDMSAVPSEHLWTLIMSCPDEPIGSEDGTKPAQEYIHWMITNLPGGREGSDLGEELIPYLPPLPYVGTGLHRYIFVLFRQDNGSIDLHHMARSQATGDLRTQRAFNMAEFYRQVQDDLTPAGLAFFQSSWDDSVRSYYRNTLNHPEPIFDIVWPDPQLPPQERHPVANSWSRPRRHPHGLPLVRERFGVHNDVSFDVYLDRYRDRKELAEEIVVERLSAEGNPLDPAEPKREQVEYPAAIPMPEDMPSWWINKEKQRRLRRGRWKYLEGCD